MPKATLIYNLDDQYERDAHTRAIKADKAYSTMYDLLQYFREQRKYNNRPEAELLIIEEVSDKFNELLSENGIDVYEEYK